MVKQSAVFQIYLPEVIYQLLCISVDIPMKVRYLILFTFETNLFAPFLKLGRNCHHSFFFWEHLYQSIFLLAGRTLRKFRLWMQRQQSLPYMHSKTNAGGPCMYRVIFVHWATHMYKMGQAFREK